MKNSKTSLPQFVRDYFAVMGAKGGSKGSREDKRKAALARWAKPGARKAEPVKSISPGTTPGEQ